MALGIATLEETNFKRDLKFFVNEVEVSTSLHFKTVWRTIGQNGHPYPVFYLKNCGNGYSIGDIMSLRIERLEGKSCDGIIDKGLLPNETRLYYNNEEFVSLLLDNVDDRVLYRFSSK